MRLKDVLSVKRQIIFKFRSTFNNNEQNLNNNNNNNNNNNDNNNIGDDSKGEDENDYFINQKNDREDQNPQFITSKLTDKANFFREVSLTCSIDELHNRMILNVLECEETSLVPLSHLLFKSITNNFFK